MLRLALMAAVALVGAETAWGQIRPLARARARIAATVPRPPWSYNGYPRGFDVYVYGRGYNGYVSPYGVYYNPQAGYVEYYLPPIEYPAELMYGPQAVRRFLGLDQVTPPTVAARPVAPPEVAEGRAPAAEGEAVELPAPKPRESNLASRERAQHFLSAGDGLFREQKHQEALQRYKSAAQAAPDLANAYFRQGFALLATNRYELAADAFRRGLELEPVWPSSGFRLEELYGEADLAKKAHQDALASAALNDPENAHLMFVLGVFLHFDGQPDRARKFFARAKELDARQAGSVDDFLAAAP
jgi:tetratricopeptide (TPR) repeat protein